MFIVCIMGMFTLTAWAQELPTASKMENQQWHEVVLIKYEAGKTGEALGIIRDHFEKAGKKAGVPGPKMFVMRTGDWDVMLVWDMDDVSEMNWQVSPEGEKWWKALAEQEGGADKAMEVWQKYIDLVENSTTALATSSKQ